MRKLIGNLKTLRRNHKLTQKKVADMAQICVRNYQNWENGTTTPDPFNLKLLELEYAALDLGFNSLNELLAKSDKIRSQTPVPQLESWYFQ